MSAPFCNLCNDTDVKCICNRLRFNYREPREPLEPREPQEPLEPLESHWTADDIKETRKRLEEEFASSGKPITEEEINAQTGKWTPVTHAAYYGAHTKFTAAMHSHVSRQIKWKRAHRSDDRTKTALMSNAHQRCGGGVATYP